MKKVLQIVFFIALVLLPFISAAQAKISVKGMVLDNDNKPILGVLVVEKGSSNATSTDVDGMYRLSNVEGKATLVFTYMGFSTLEEKVEGRTTVNVRLTEDAQALEDVVVVAFGTQKKESVVGSITSVSPKALKVPSSNLTTAFQGRMAGMISYQRSGEPGADNAEFFIRGVTTFGTGRVDPLILIDDIESDATELARVNADDIEDFSLLKDATATALYGSRGANGVVLIKTKAGHVGKAKLSFRLENAFSAPTSELEFADPITFMRLHNEAVLTRDPLRPEPYSQEKIDNTLQPGSNHYIYPATDWKSELLRNYTTTQRASLNVSGGGDVATYFVSGSFSQDNGLFKVDQVNNFNNNIDLKKISIRANVDIKVTSTTKLKVMTTASFDDYTGPPFASASTSSTGGAEVYKAILRTNPVMFPAQYPKPNELNYLDHILFGNSDESGQLYLNPYAAMVRGYQEYSRSNVLASAELKQDLDFFTEGLKFRALFNTSRLSYYSISRMYDPFYYKLSSWDKYADNGVGTYNIMQVHEGTEYLNWATTMPSVKFNTYVEGAFIYNREFGDHSLSAMLVGQMRNISNPTRTNAAGVVDLQSALPERNLGLSGRATYGFAQRYFAEFNFGYNGSERFSEDHRFGFFPSVGAGWVISNESFWDPIKPIFEKFKLRYSYGLIGNDQIGSERFLYLSNVSFNGTSVGFGTSPSGSDRYSNTAVTISRYANSDITWETSKKANYAVEFTTFGIDVVAEYYTEHRENILLPRTNMPTTMGLWATVYSNVGEAIAKGVDISVDYNKVFNSKVWLQARATFTYAHSEYLKYADFDYQNEWWKYHPGYPISQTWGYIAEGLFVDDADVANSPRQQFGEYLAGDIKYRDVNGDGQITDLDMVPIGYPTTPEINYGFGPSVGFYGLDFSMYFSGVGRASFWIDYEAVSPFVDVSTGNGVKENNVLSQFIVESYWSEDNKNSYAVWPRLSETVITNNDQTSTWFMRDGTFLRLKQMELGYTIPEDITTRLRIKTARFYVSATNLLVWSKFKLWDPEMAGNGLGYPLQRVVNLGLQLTF
jgi:TonB-linked SusC/RagA family outer membrane protein